MADYNVAFFSTKFKMLGGEPFHNIKFYGATIREHVLPDDGYCSELSPATVGFISLDYITLYDTIYYFEPIIIGNNIYLIPKLEGSIQFKCAKQYNINDNKEVWTITGEGISSMPESTPDGFYYDFKENYKIYYIKRENNILFLLKKNTSSENSIQTISVKDSTEYLNILITHIYQDYEIYYEIISERDNTDLLLNEYSINDTYKSGDDWCQFPKVSRLLINSSISISGNSRYKEGASNYNSIIHVNDVSSKISEDDSEYGIYKVDGYYMYDAELPTKENPKAGTNNKYELELNKNYYIRVDIYSIKIGDNFILSIRKNSVPILINYKTPLTLHTELAINEITFNSVFDYDFTKFKAFVNYEINDRNPKTIQVPFYNYTISEAPFKFLTFPYKVLHKNPTIAEGEITEGLTRVFQIENGTKNLTFVSNNVTLNSSETFLDKIQEKKSEGDLQFDAILINPSDSSDIRITDNEGNNLDNTKTYKWDNGNVKKIDLGIEFLEADGKLVPVVSDIEMFKQTSKNISSKPIFDLAVHEDKYWGKLFWNEVPVIANENLKEIINGGNN